jgi:hypothetical protein
VHYRDAVLDLLGQLSVYRERVWQTLTAGQAAAGYYTQATNVLHLDLLPAAERLRTASEKRLSFAYAEKRVTEVTGVTLAVVLGAALILRPLPQPAHRVDRQRGRRVHPAHRRRRRPRAVRRPDPPAPAATCSSRSTTGPARRAPIRWCW